jgi:hypothetical protein
MIFAHLPVSFHCPEYCIWAGLVGYAASAVNDKWLGGDPFFDPFEYLLFVASPQYSQLRGSGSYSKHTAKGGCGVLPAPYQTRLTHHGASAAKDQYPYSQYFDFSFHTSFQAPPTNPLVPLLSTNMDPTPTLASASLPQISCNPLPITVDFTWTYNLLMVMAWNSNVIFSGLDNYNPINWCGNDQFWTWYGAHYSSLRGLPTVNWTAGFKGGHLPYI